MNIDWKTDEYGKKFSFVGEYGKALVSLLSTGKGARVLDLGCGRGELTAYLRSLGYDAEGMDASESQLEEAKRLFPEIKFFRGDITEFSTDRLYDAVFSNAVLHWIDAEKQKIALANVCRALKRGGEFVAEMGGKGNAEIIHSALKEEILERGGEYRHAFFFSDEKEYGDLLKECGFEVKYIARFDRPTPLCGQDGIADWIEMFAAYELSALNEKDRRDCALAAQERCANKLLSPSGWTADYVRLRFKAVKPR